MQVIVFGAGGIGGVIGAQLFRQGQPVQLIARGAHLAAIQQSGLGLELPGESLRLPIQAVADPSHIDWDQDDPAVVILAVKSQDTEQALRSVALVAPPQTAVVCAQNGVENERRALRLFANTYAMCVMCPTTHLEPGVVQAHSAPVTGLLDLGRYPNGVDPLVETLARAMNEASFDSRAVPDVMRWKYTKLLKNLSNAVEALCGPAGRGSEIDTLARREGEAALRAAGIDFASDAEDAQRRGSLLQLQRTRRSEWSGGSSWQSLARGAGSIEADYLNAEIVLLGRLHGVATPANELLGRMANESACSGSAPGQWRPDQLVDLLGA
jgi:2-dehydropantoate 2-reductase